MPEGPECRRITEKLRVRLKGRSLLWISCNVNEGKYYSHLSSVYPSIENLFPLTCLDIICRGKQIFWFFSNNISFVSGLGLEGHWYYLDLRRPSSSVVPTPSALPTAGAEVDTNYLLEEFQALSKPNLPVDSNQQTALITLSSGQLVPKYGKFCLHFGKVTRSKPLSFTNDESSGTWFISDTEIWYDDKLSYGNFTIGNWEIVNNKIKELGPDLLATTYLFNDIHPIVRQSLPQIFFQPATIESFVAGIRMSRRSQMELYRFLMKQEYFSGIGNYLKSEIMYRAGLHPLRQLGTLTDDEISRLFGACLNTISQAYQYGGLTHGTFLDPDFEKGTFPVYVYKRKGELDPNGFTVQAQKFDDRTTFFVPEVQK